MTETTASLEAPRRFHFNWTLPLLISPRRVFARLAELTGDAWLTPLVLLMIFALANALVTGWIRQTTLGAGPAELPDDFQFWPTEQQQSFMQAQAATQGPVFVYVFPGALALIGVWMGWLITFGLLHLVFTLLGGRGSTRTAMNVVAWASLPFAVRHLVQTGYMLIQRQLIQAQGLAGFAPESQGVSAYLSVILGLIDLYFIWHVVLLIVGVRASNGLPRGKAIAGVLITMALVLLIESLPGFLSATFSGLQIVRPFFF
jgi:hypothetical protein